MKVGIVTTWFDRGAAYVSKQFRDVWLEKDNTEVFIYARGGEMVDEKSPVWSHINVTYGKRFNYTMLDRIDLKHFERWIVENKLDMVFFNEQHIWHPVILCSKLGVMTGAYIDYYTKETVELFGLYDFLICNTKRHYSVFDWHNQVYYVPWGTDIKIFNENQSKKSSVDEIVFFHSAGMNPYRKGTDYVIKAFSALKNDKAKLIIHTQQDLYKFFPKIKNDVRELVNKRKIQIIQKTVAAPGLYKLGDVYVYPTRLEGIGLTIAEANACGLPVITTNEAPMNEFVKEGVNGSLIDVSEQKYRGDGYFWPESYIDVNHLIRIMNEYLNKDYSTIQKFKNNSINYSKTNLNWHTNSIRLNEILDEIHLVKDKSVYEEKALVYEKSRGIKYHIGHLKLYRRIKRYFSR